MTLSSSFGRATAWIVDRPVWAYLFLLAVSSVATLGYVAPERVRDLLRRSEPRDAGQPSSNAAPPSRKPRPDVEALELTRADAVLVIESDDIFTPEGAKALRHMVGTLEGLPHVRNVVWMDRVPVLNIFGLREPLFPKEQASATRFEAARQRAARHPLVNGQLLSSDGCTLVVLVNFDWLYITEDEDCSRNLRVAAEQALANFPQAKFTVGVTGSAPLRLTMMQTHERNNLKFRIIGYGVVLVMAAILFRGIVSVFVVSLGPAMGIFWTIGFLNFLDLRDNPFNDVVLPVMLSLIGLADGVHLMVQMRRFRAAGMSERRAARAGLEEVGLACFLTAVTTSIGFASLSFAQHEIVREFGWSCVLGVSLTVVAILVVVPLAYFSPPAKFLQHIASRKVLGVRLEPVEQQAGLLEGQLHRVIAVVDLVLRYRTRVAWTGIAVTVLCAAIALQLRPDETRSSFLPEHAEATRVLHQMDRAMGGLEFSEVRIHWSADIPSDSPEVLKVVTLVDDLLKSEPLIGSPISIRSLLDALPGDSPTTERASMIDLLPPPLKRAFYEPEAQQANVTFRVRDIGIAKYSPVFERIESRLQQIETEHRGFDLQLTGSAVFRWRDLYRIALDLGSSLGSETFIIICVLAAVFRSVRLGLIALVPNIFPLVLCATWMVLTGQPLEIVTVCSFTICLGIAVDDTIHFLTRFEEELSRSASRKEAIRKTFEAVGTSMLMTTLVLVCGFATVTFSDMRDQRLFATMGMSTMLTAVIGDLIILPALLAKYALPAPGEGRSSTALLKRDAAGNGSTPKSESLEPIRNT